MFRDILESFFIKHIVYIYIYPNGFGGSFVGYLAYHHTEEMAFLTTLHAGRPTWYFARL